MKIKLCIGLFIILAVSCKTIDHGRGGTGNIDYKLYQGKWYEIARLPNPVEAGLDCITMTYEYQDEGVMTVTSIGKNRDNYKDVRSLTGRAWIPDEKEPKNIKIQFIWPVTRDYQLVHIDQVKGLAILGSPMKHQLWILSRTPSVSEDDMRELLEIARKNQFKTENLMRVEHKCE